jgi:hypothetical protein
MWVEEVTGECAATPDEVFAVMVLSDGAELPFHLTWVEEGRGFEDVTPVPDAGVTVRVVHEVKATATGAAAWLLTRWSPAKAPACTCGGQP